MLGLKLNQVSKWGLRYVVETIPQEDVSVVIAEIVLLCVALCHVSVLTHRIHNEYRQYDITVYIMKSSMTLKDLLNTKRPFWLMFDDG